jgi:L-aspartate oxidase
MRADVVVVGSGLAGLLTALDLEGMRVVVVTSSAVGDGTSSAWAQGGVAAALGADDSPELHAKDTIAVGGGLVDAALATSLAREAPAAIDRLIALGARLDRDRDGALAMGREAAHSRRRIVHANGDATGAELLRAVSEAARRAPHVRLLEHSTLCDIVVSGDRVAGVRVLSAGGRVATILAPRVVLATGGLGALFAYTTNPRGQWGAGLAAAARAGALLADLEFVQFHPTALDAGADPMPLVSEAVRGEGASLVDDRGARIMAGVDPRGDLAPRDVVARAVFRSMQDGRRVYLDARTALGAGFAERFPRIFSSCVAVGVDPSTQMIPIAPAAHYHMGGVAVDARGRSSIDGLWACGEVSATGLHGANRLASNSLLEALVFPGRVAQDIVGSESGRARISAPRLPQSAIPYSSDADEVFSATIRARMFEGVGIERDGERLQAAMYALQGIERRGPSRRVRDMATVGALVARSALDRRESRGSHYRVDYPETAQHGARSFVRLEYVEVESPAISA